MASNPNHASQFPPVGLARRIGAMVYDALLLFSVLFFATVPLLAFTHGEAVSPQHPLYSLYLLAVSFVYFGWAWTRGGQTLGMKTWRIEVVDAAGGRISWRQAALRFVAALLAWAPLGLGFVAALWHPQRLAWHDRCSRTRLVRAVAQ